MKELSSTLAGILVLVFAVLPGVPGDRLYRIFVGSDWREDQWQKTIRLLGFSLFGLALYASIAPLLKAPFPSYLSPILLEQAAKDEASFRRMLLALLGHFSGSAVAGSVAGLGMRSAARIMSASAFSGAWDHFVRHCAKDHWVIVTLQNGESYSGFIETADVSVASDERDVILREPGEYDATTNVYEAMQYQSLFIPGSFLSSIATVYNPSDKRIIPVGEAVFVKENSHVIESEPSSTKTGQGSGLSENPGQSLSSSLEATGPGAQTSSRAEIGLKGRAPNPRPQADG